MQRFFALAVVMVASFGAALAQAPEPPPAFEPQWRDGLSVPQFLYPEEARPTRAAGDVRLCCPVDDNGQLECAVVAATPDTGMFNEAATTAATWLSLSDESLAALRAHGDNAAIALSMRFFMDEGPADFIRNAKGGFDVIRHFMPQTVPSYAGLCRGRIVRAPPITRQR